MAPKNIPIVCTLNDVEFRDREYVVLGKIKRLVLETAETGNGYIFLFPSDDASFAALNEFIVLERRCCPFLDFQVTIPRGEAILSLELSGDAGAKEFIATTFVD